MASFSVVSNVSANNAQANLNAENPAGTSFDTVRQQAFNRWNTELGRIEIAPARFSGCSRSWRS